MGGSCSQTGTGRISAEPDGNLEDVLTDGRFLADFVVYLEEQRNYSAIQSLYLYELNEGDVHETELESLENLWEAYKQSPEGLGNFTDTKEWAPHDYPASFIVEYVQGKQYVDKNDAQYEFAIGAMVGIHVATVCSQIVDNSRTRFGTPQSTLGEDADILLSEASRVYYIPTEGSAYSPKTILPSPFIFRELAPAQFAQLRHLYGLSDSEYMDSLCRTDFTFIKFGTNSKSGEFFFFTHDMKFLLKTTTSSEREKLIDMLPDLIVRFREEPRSFLGKYCGLYTLNYEGTATTFFIMVAVSGGSTLQISKTFDLKGSERGRLANPNESVGKDVNFRREVGCLHLPYNEALDVQQIHEEDVDLLANHRIMDYSLLVQIHDKEVKKENADAHLNKVSVAKNGKGSWTRTRSMPFATPHLPMPDQTLLHGTLNGGAKSKSQGIVSQCGRYTYFLGLIDMLVQYDLYPQAQYAGTQIITCGKANEASRIPPNQYRDRQVDMLQRICPTAPQDEDAASQVMPMLQYNS